MVEGYRVRPAYGRAVMRSRDHAVVRSVVTDFCPVISRETCINSSRKLYLRARLDGVPSMMAIFYSYRDADRVTHSALDPVGR